MGRKEIALLSYNSGALGEMGTDKWEQMVLLQIQDC